MSDTSIVFNVLARDRASSVFRKIRESADDTGKTLALAFGPALMPILASSAAGIAGVGAALAGVGASAGVFGAVFKSSFTEVQTASQKTAALQDKIALLGQRIDVANKTGIGNAEALAKAQANAQNELLARYAQMPPALRQVTMAYDGMKASWKGFVDQNKPATFGIMTSGFSLLSSIIPKLQPLFDTAAGAVRRLMDSLTGWAGRGGVDGLVAFLNGQAGPALDNLIRIGKNVIVTFGRFFSSFASQGQGILSWLADASDKMAAWSGGGGLQKFIDYVSSNGPMVVSALTNVATAAVHIAQAVSPLAPVSLAIATALAAIIAAIPPGVITVLVAGWLAYTVALKGYYAYTVIVGAATKAWAAIQWLLNVAMTANPIGLIVIAIVALIAIIVLIATKTTWFQTIWKAVWDFMKAVGAWFAGPFADFFVSMWNKIVASLNRAKAQFMAVIAFIKNLFLSWVAANAAVANKIIAGFNKVVSFVKSAPGKIKGALSSMFTPLWAGFKSAVNNIIRGWNSLHFGIPGFSFAGLSVPGINVSTPNIPYLARGGDVLGSGLAVIHKGETVTPAAKVRRQRSAGDGTITLDLRGADSDLQKLFRKWLRTGALTL